MKKWKRIVSSAGVLIFLFVLFFSAAMPAQEVNAAGFVDDTVNTANLYSRYPIANYQLDYYMDTTWDFLPWNLMDGIVNGVYRSFHVLMNGAWSINLFASTATGYIVQEAYELDFISAMADNIGKNIQTIAGLSEKGIAATGFYPGFLPWIILAVGGYVAYVGLVKREFSKAMGALLNMLVIFLVTSSFIVFAPEYITNVNELSSDISNMALDMGTSLLIVQDDEDGKATSSTDQIRNNLFALQVYKPWLYLQYGTTDEEAIGKERIESLLSVNPVANFGKDRILAAKEEIETYKNTNMTGVGAIARFGPLFTMGILNLVISFFICAMAGLMLLSQILFIIFSMILPVSFIISMFPGNNALAKKAVVKVFNLIMTRAGLTLIVTIALSLSAMLYGLSSSYPLVMTAFLQIVVYVGIWLKLTEILEMMSLKGNGNERRNGSLMRSLTRYLVMRKLLGGHRGMRRVSTAQQPSYQNNRSPGGGSATKEPVTDRSERSQNEDTIHVKHGFQGMESMSAGDRSANTKNGMAGKRAEYPVYGDIVDWKENVGDLKEFEAEQQKWSNIRKGATERRAFVNQAAVHTRKGDNLRYYVDTAGLSRDVAKSAATVGADGRQLENYREKRGIRRAVRRNRIYRDTAGRIRTYSNVGVGGEENMIKTEMEKNQKKIGIGMAGERKMIAQNEGIANDTIPAIETDRQKTKQYQVKRGPQLASGSRKDADVTPKTEKGQPLNIGREKNIQGYREKKVSVSQKDRDFKQIRENKGQDHLKKSEKTDKRKE